MRTIGRSVFRRQILGYKLVENLVLELMCLRSGLFNNTDSGGGVC